MSGTTIAGFWTLVFILLLATPPAFAVTSGISANHSAGIILLGDGLANCHAAENGGIRWNSSSTKMQYCNGVTWQNIGAGAATAALSAVTAATGTNTIDNGAGAQTWQWNTLAGGNGFYLTSSSTVAASNAQTLLNISTSGTNATSTQTTYGEQISNAHSGTTTTNVALSASASGATNNYAAIFNGGWVGIGTTTPLASLHVAGTSNATIYVDEYLTGGNPSLVTQMARGTSGSPTAAQNGDTMLYIGGRGYGATGFGAADSSSISLKATENYTDAAQGGNITFATTKNGTVSPQTRMTVTATPTQGVGDAGVTVQIDQAAPTTISTSTMYSAGGAQAKFVDNTDAGYMIMARTNAEYGGWLGYGYLWAGAGASDLFIDTNGNDRMDITAGGLIGVNTYPGDRFDIYTSSPTGLHIKTTNESPWAIMLNNLAFGSTDGTGFGFFQFNNGTAAIYNNSHSGIQFTSTNVALLAATTTVNPNSASIITNTGLAIRQYADDAYFDSVGGIQFNVDTDNSGGEGLAVYQGTTPTLRLLVDSGGDLDLATAGTYLNWGATIGTTGYGFRDNAGTIQWKNSGGAWAAVGNTSDMRLKRDIADLPENDGLAAIMKLRPVRFRWKDMEQDKTQGPQIGLIAQEVEKVYPDSGLTFNFGDVKMTLPDGKKQTVKAARGMSYEKLVAPLIKSVQQQQAEIDGLKAGDDDLLREARALEKRMGGDGLKQ